MQSSELPCSTNLQFDVIMIGQNVPRKNYEFALKVISSASITLGRPLHLCLVGSMTDQINYDGFASQISITTHQNITNESLSQKILSSKVFMNASIVEGLHSIY